jgi:hypothetical protein
MRWPWIPSSLMALAACGGGLPSAYPWALSAQTLEALAQRPADLQQVEQQLAAHFGSAAAPRPIPLPDGSTPWDLHPERLSERLATALTVDNQRRFSDLLDGLERGTLTGLEWPPAVEALGAQYAEQVAAGSTSEAEAARAASAAVRQWLPDLARSARVYGQNCVTCHGPSGGGDGPSATVLTAIPPRDFRSGEFVHFVAERRPRPSREELVDVLHRGVPGTPMASFKGLSSSELIGLADYVRLLSVRGAFERALVAEWQRGGAPDAARRNELYAAAWAPWLEGGAD